MAEVLRDGTGNAYDAKVDVNNRLFVTGSITNMPGEHNYIQRLDYSGTMNVPVYIGLAVPGNAVGDAAWQIKQLNYGTNSMVSGILFASGNTTFDKHWDARTSGPYS